MKIKDGFIVRKVAGGNVVVPVGKMCDEFRGMITLNDSACFLWNFFSSDHVKDDAVAALSEEYGIGKELALKDVDNFIEKLSEHGLLV